jgi:hypothetical protein
MRSLPFRHSGLDLQNSHINLGGQFLSFVPYSMSLSMIRALVSMSEREIAFFREYQGAVQTMKLTFNSHVYGRKVDFQIWGKIADLRQVNPDLNMVLMDFVVRRIANAYREIFIDMAMKDDRLRALYNDEELGLRRFDGDCVREIFGDNQTSLIPGPQTPGMFRITSLSLKRLRIYGPVPSELETLGLLLKIPFLSEYPPWFSTERWWKTNAPQIPTTTDISRLKSIFIPTWLKSCSPFYQEVDTVR